MKKATRKSSIGLQEGLTTIGNFSTRFSMPSFVKRVERLNNDQRSLIEKTGFGNLLLLPNQMVSKNLLVELMARWSCEKRAFLLTPGNKKLTITLLDVGLIMGLPVIGDPVVLKDDEPLSDLERQYGAVLWKRKIAVGSLEKRLDSLGEMANADFVRSFLLFTIGTLLFPNSNGKVNSRYLHFLEDLDVVKQFSWGAAVLEEMFLWLNKRKEINVQYMGGCLILLQIWSYEHINIARPNFVDGRLTFPRACRWENIKSHHRQWFTAKFKELQDHQITWKLQATPSELEVDIIKQLLETHHGEEEFLTIRSSSTSCSMISVVEVASNSDMNLSDGADEVQHIDLEPLMLSQNESMAPKDVLDCPSTSCSSELHPEHTELALQSDDSCINFTRISENDLRMKNLALDEQITKLQKEIEELRCENRSLKDKLSSSLLLEEQNVQLKKEVETLKRENQCLSFSSTNLVDRLERILLYEDVNDQGQVL